jgi:chitin disaccharide deacetylase
MAVTLITRADDLGSSNSANIAITLAVKNGDYIKNVSCMAPGSYIEEGVEMIKGCKNVCFGMHAILNSEWEFIKWQPLSPLNEISTITTPSGTFYSDPSIFYERKPSIEEILIEYNRQLDYLQKLGLNVSYVDSHMLPELYIQGLSEAMTNWIREKGLIDHIEYYNFPSIPQVHLADNLEENIGIYEKWLSSIVDGQYFVEMHPAKYSREMLLYANQKIPVGLVAKARNAEYEWLLSGAPEKICEKLDIKRLRYDKAEKLGNTFEYIKNLLKNARQ